MFLGCFSHKGRSEQWIRPQFLDRELVNSEVTLSINNLQQTPPDRYYFLKNFTIFFANLTPPLSLSSSGMGLLKDHGGLTLDLVAPPVEDLWGLFSSAMFAIQIFRAEMLCQKFDPLRLVATLLGVLAVLSIGWEGWSLLHAGNGIEPLERQLRGLPVWPLMYGGLIAGGEAEPCLSSAVVVSMPGQKEESRVIPSVEVYEAFWGFLTLQRLQRWSYFVTSCASPLERVSL